jgi:hypothetical protein
VASYNDGAPSRGMLLVDVVLGTKADLARGVLQGVGILVLADGADEDDGIRWQHVLGNISCGGKLGISDRPELLLRYFEPLRRPGG